MAHEITIREDGFAEAAFALRPAWHGLGQVFDRAMLGEEALIGAGLNVRVIQSPVFRQHRRWNELSAIHITDYEQITGYQFNTREDTGAVLGLVTDAYKVVQNIEAFQFLDALVENHEMRYESAFSLRGGRKVVLLARLPGADRIVEGDHVLRYVLLSLSHDGTEAIRFGPCAVRVVCANTYAIALGEGYTHELSIRHTGNVMEKLAQARNILTVASERFAQYAEHSQALARARLDACDWEEYLDIMCPVPSHHDPDWTQKREDRITVTRLGIRTAYSNARQSLPGIKDTCWAAYNAVAEHIDHLPRRGATPRARVEARFNVALYGAGRDAKERAFQTACRFAGIGQTGA